MIKGIILQNFQSHKKTVIKFSKGLNIISGENDAGKTAIIRALRWVMFNDLKGDYFRSKWGGVTRVTIALDSGDKISRVRDGKENYYLVNGEKLSGFGTGVPDTVKELLKIDMLNFQSQFENVFLFSYSQGETTRLFNELFRLDEIDKFVGILRQKKTECTGKVRHYKERIEGTKTDLERLKWVDDAKKKLDNYNTLQIQIRDLRELIEKVKNVLFKIDELKEIDEKEVKKAEKLYKRLEGIEEREEELRFSIENLRVLIFNLKQNDEEFQDKKKELKAIEKEMKSLVGETCPYCGRVIDETLINK